MSERDLDPLDLTEAGDAYSIVGYPAFKSKGTETSLTVFDGAGLSDAYRDLLADERTHLIVRFRPDRAINYANASIGAKPSFSGVSGGGVFAWSKDLPNPNALSQPKLAGIVTEYSSRHSAFVCTRIGFLLSAMQRHFPDMQFGEVPYQRQIKSRDK